MKKLTVVIVALFAAAFGTVSNVHAATPDWDISGTWSLELTFTNVGVYTHSMEITSQSVFTGAFDGGGFYLDNPGVTWDVNDGAVIDGDEIEFSYVYTGIAAGFSNALTGTVAPDGLTMSGTFTDSMNRPGTWIATGIAQPVTHTGSISGMKFHDMNGNGIRDVNAVNPENSEPGLEDWTIAITRSGESVVLTEETDEDGQYSFIGIPNGTYEVTEMPQTGWVQTHPTTTPGYIVEITDANQVVTGADFGNFQSVVISGTVYEDMDGNAQFGTGDLPLGFWEVSLFDGNGVFLSSDLTDANGLYEFTEIGPGDYFIGEAVPDPWNQSEPGAAYSYAHFVTPESGVAITRNFGNYRHGSIQGRKYQDLDFDGMRDSGEPWLSGWTITAYHLGSGGVFETTTNTFGKYRFLDIPPGMYIVKETLQSGWIFVEPNVGSYQFTLHSNEQIKNKNFGNNTIANYVAWRIISTLPMPIPMPLVNPPIIEPAANIESPEEPAAPAGMSEGPVDPQTTEPATVMQPALERTSRSIVNSVIDSVSDTLATVTNRIRRR